MRVLLGAMQCWHSGLYYGSGWGYYNYISMQHLSTYLFAKYKLPLHTDRLLLLSLVAVCLLAFVC